MVNTLERARASGPGRERNQKGQPGAPETVLQTLPVRRANLIELRYWRDVAPGLQNDEYLMNSARRALL